MIRSPFAKFDLGLGEVPAPALSVLVTLFLQTSLLLLVSQSVLSQNLGMTWAAVRIFSVLLVWTGVAAAVQSWTGSARLGIAVSSIGLVLALFVPAAWLWTVALIVTAFWASRPGSVEILRLWRRVDLWGAAAMSAALILAVTLYADFSVMDKLRQGLAHQDLLFHAAISAMLKTYDAVSTGLHGLAPLAYHVWAHRLLAAISAMAGVPVLETYGIAPALVLCPLLLFAVAWAGCAVGRGQTEAHALRSWVVVTSVLVVFKVLPLEWWGGWDSYFVSESYTLGLVYFVLALPAIVSRDRTVPALLISGLLLVLAGVSKLPFGFFGLLIAGAIIVLIPPPSGRRNFLLALVAPLAAIIWLMGSIARATVDGSASYWVPFGTLRTHAVWGSHVGGLTDALVHGRLPDGWVLAKAVSAIVMFVVMTFALSWAVLIRRVSLSGLRSVLRHEDGVATLVAIGVGLAVLVIGPPGDWYFLNQAMFVALVCLVWPLANREAALPLDRRRQLAMSIVLAAIWMLVVESRAPFGGVYLKTRQNVLDQGDRGRVNPHVDALLDLRRRDVAKTVVFQADATFPKPAPGIWNCYQVPFAYPAVTERAWIGIIEPASSCVYSLWGYPVFFDRTVPRKLLNPVLPPGTTILTVSGSPEMKTVPPGEWITPVYSAASFSGSGGMTWSVEPKDVSAFSYTRIGHTMILAFDLDGTSVAGRPGVALQIALPDGAVAAGSTFDAFQARDNGRDIAGMAQVVAGKTDIYLYNGPVATLWSPSANFTRVAGTLTFQVR